MAWLDDRGISVAGLWAEHFNAGWMLRAARRVTGQLNTTLSFWLITLVYVMLGLLEVDVARRKVEALANRDASRYLIAASAATAQKFRKYMFIRTQMSIVTGLLVWVFAWIAGLQFAAEWGVIAFVLNYIPFIGPFVATLFPTLLAMMQFDSWQAVVGLFIGLNLIQFAVGTYVEPRVSGDALAMSPFLVLFAVFFWAYLWGMFGAFIGDPIAVAILTFCRFQRLGPPDRRSVRRPAQAGRDGGTDAVELRARRRDGAAALSGGRLAVRRQGPEIAPGPFPNELRPRSRRERNDPGRRYGWDRRGQFGQPLSRLICHEPGPPPCHRPPTPLYPARAAPRGRARKPVCSRRPRAGPPRRGGASLAATSRSSIPAKSAPVTPTPPAPPDLGSLGEQMSVPPIAHAFA